MRKDWVQNIIDLSGQGRKNEFIPHVFWALGVTERTFTQAERTKDIIAGLTANPVVYYFGAGSIARLNIDIIYPLAATDFSLLFAVDREPRDANSGDLYPKFIQSVTLNLSLIDEIRQEDIFFEKLTHCEFRAVFDYEKISREVRFFSCFDATRNSPAMISGGYHVLFTRRTGSLFSLFNTEVREYVLRHLCRGGMAIFQELVSDQMDIGEKAIERQRWLGESFENILNESALIKEGFADELICFKKISE